MIDTQLTQRQSTCLTRRNPQRGQRAFPFEYYEEGPTIHSYSTLPTTYQRKEQILYNRLRTGHTRLTRSYLIEHTDPPKCTNCNQLLSNTYYQNVLHMIKHDNNTIPLLTLKTSSIIHPAKITKFYLIRQLI